MQFVKLSPLLELNSPIEKQQLISTLNSLLDGNLMGVQLHSLTSEPPKKDGLVVYTDATKWNPGSGQGFYGYYGGVWRKIG